MGYALQVTLSLQAQDRTLVFGTEDVGVSKPIPTWGLDLAWNDENNVRRGSIFMGPERVDTVRISFTPTAALVNGDLQAAELTILNNRLTWVDRWTTPATTLYINEDSPVVDPYFLGSNGSVNPTRWAEVIDVTTRRAQEWGRTVEAVSPFNEPDFTRSERPASMQTFMDTLALLEPNPRFAGIRLSGGNTLNTDQANPWYNFLKSRLDEGNTHQLAGNFDNYASFFQNVRTSGDRATNDELHNVMEAMVGAEYGMQNGIWWGTAELARGEFVKASDGMRLAYAEHRPNWTAASVYRAPSGRIQAFVGESERQALPTTYRFFSKDRDVFFDGHGPRRDLVVSTSGGPGYQTQAHRNAERVINITWGADIQPAIGGRYSIVNRASGKVLEIENASGAEGASLRQNTHTAARHQQWDVHPQPHTFGGDYSYFPILAAHSGKALDLINYSHNDRAEIIQYGTGASINQHWFLEYVGENYFRIRNRWSGKCLMPLNGAQSNGAQVVQMTLDEGSLAQQWRLVPADAPVEFVAPSAPSGLQAVSRAVSVALTWNANTESDVASYHVYRTRTVDGSYELIARGLSSPSFIDASANQAQSYFYVVKAADRSGNLSGYSAQVSATPSGEQTLVASYAFEGDARDGTVNGNDATVIGAQVFGAGRGGSRAIALNGVDSFVDLPPEVASFSRLTIATWVYWTGGGNWQRIFDFGNGTSSYLYLTPNFGGGMRFAIQNGGPEQVLVTSALPINQWVHVAITLGDSGGTLYVNGTSVASSSSITIRPDDFRPAANRIGKSQFDADPLFRGLMDQFLVYNHALSSVEIAALAAETPTASYEPIVRMKLDETAGTSAADSSGNGWNATTAGAPTWISGRFDNAIALGGSGAQHLAFPAGVLDGVGDFTFSTWVRVNTLTTFSRIFDFGGSTAPSGSTGSYLFLAPSNGSAVTFAITSSGFQNEQRIQGSTTLPVGEWCHVAVTAAGSLGRLYVNGVLVGSNSSFTLRPANLGRLTNNYLGRSQFAPDPYLNGALDDFRIYARALSPTEIAEQAAALPNRTPAFAANPLSEPAATAGVVYAASLAGDASDADAESLTFEKLSGPAWLSVAANGALSGFPVGADAGPNLFTVRVSDPKGARAETTVRIQVNSIETVVSLRMDEGAGTVAYDESGNGWDATVVNGPTRDRGRLFRALRLDGVNDHLTLPTGVVATLNDSTFSIWARADSVATWARVFDFGSSAENHLFLTLRSPTGRPRFSMRSAEIGDQVLDSSVAFPLGAWTHLAITLEGTTARMYLNGMEVGSNTSFMLKPMSLGATTQNYLGRSRFSDPYLAASLDEFRIYSRALGATEIAELASPPNSPLGLVSDPSDTSITLTWNPVAGATGYRVKRASTNGGPYAVIAEYLLGTSHVDASLQPSTGHHYIVTAMRSVSESASSSQVSVTTLAPRSAWRKLHFGTTSNGGDAADTSDPDGDGHDNLLEYATGTLPLVADATAAVVQGTNGDFMTLTFSRIADPTLTYGVRASNDLASWTTVASYAGFNTSGTTLYTDTVSIKTTPLRFLRLEVIAP